MTSKRFMFTVGIVGVVAVVLILATALPLTKNTWNKGGVTEYHTYQGNMVGQKFQGLPKPNFTYNAPYFGTSIDIDNDGIKETTFYTKVAMTKPPHFGYIVKEGHIIFASNMGANIQIQDLEDKDTQGFYVVEKHSDADKGKDGWKYTKFSYKAGVINKMEEKIVKGD